MAEKIETKHTPEPWVESSSGKTAVVIDENNVQWVVLEGSRHGLVSNLRRAIACVNACAGIENPEAVGGLLGLCKEMATEIGYLADEFNLHGLHQQAVDAIAKVEGRS